MRRSSAAAGLNSTAAGIPPGRHYLADVDIIAPASSDYREITLESVVLPVVGGEHVPMVVDSNFVGWETNMIGRIVEPGGDVNLDRAVTSADIIYLVNYAFKSGEAPVPHPIAGDQNCNGSSNSADIIVLVNYVFKSGAEPCDIHVDCTMADSSWSCP